MKKIIFLCPQKFFNLCTYISNNIFFSILLQFGLKFYKTKIHIIREKDEYKNNTSKYMNEIFEERNNERNNFIFY